MAASRKPSHTVAPDSPASPELHVVKKGSTPTISGRSTLHYEVGVDQNGYLHLQLTSNSGSGMFSKRWIPMADIRKALGTGGPITALRLAPLTRGRSANDAGFILAVLKAEGLIRTAPDKQRVHVLADGSDFDTQMARLTEPVPSDAKIGSKAAPSSIDKPKSTNSSKSAPKSKGKPFRR